jgi:hypothetical protein
MVHDPMEPKPSRPNLPPGYGIEKATGSPGEHLPWKRLSQWLEDARNYWVCTTRSDGRPHSKPVWGLWLDGEFAFSTHPETVTACNLRTNSQVTVHLESGDQVLILEGTARRIFDQPILVRFGRMYEAKYQWPMSPEDVDAQNPNAAFYLVRPQSAVSWGTSTEVGETITHWSFEGADP